ncbi:MAG TPA: hypothetical protein VN193_13400 [Candidatus Angelobacter sp.]|jgi:hypothetical protein|nr:hypothetical protein [Candidatus Angelobacter sp.]
MPRPLSCPVCRIDLPEGDTHCPRCGLRIAALPRRPRHAVAADASTSAAVDSAGAPLTVAEALSRGALGGVALVLLSALVALVVTRGNAFAAGMSNATFFAGGVTVTAAVVLGGLRIRRVLDSVETMRRRALHGPDRLAHDHVRLAVAVAGGMALVVAVVLAVVAH